MSELACAALPWLATAALVVGIAARALGVLGRTAPGSSRLLEDRLLFLGTVPLCVALATLAAGHVAFLLCGAGEFVDGPGVRLLVESSGVAAGLLCAGGLCILLVRRADVANWRFADSAVAGLLLVQATTGVGVAISSRWISAWAPELVAPYLRSALSLHPDAGAIATLPGTAQLHVATGWVIVALAPFTRLAQVGIAPLAAIPRAVRALMSRRENRR